MNETANPRRGSGRLAGLLYLVVIAAGVFGVGYARGSLVVAGDAAGTLASIASSEALWRLGVVAQFVMYAAYAGVTAILYTLLKPAGSALSAAAAAFSLLGIATGGVAVAVNAATPLVAPDAPVAVVEVLLRLFAASFSVSIAFFGVYMTLLGLLIIRSGIVPAVLGVLMMAGGLGHLADNAFYFLDAPAPAAIAPYLGRIAIVAELLFALWLTVVGAGKTRQPR